MYELQQLMAAGMRVGNAPGVDTALEHLSDGVDLRFVSVAGMSSLPDARLELLLRSRPSMLTDLVTPANVASEFMERVIRLPHKPTTQAANKVSMHHDVLSQFALDYVRAHGGKVAHSNLWERHYQELPTASLLDVQSVLFHKFSTFAEPSRMWAGGSSTHKGWRQVLKQSVDLLSQAGDAHKKSKGFSSVRERVVQAALETGLPVPDALVGPGGRALTVQSLVEAARAGAPVSTLGWNGGTALCRNPEFLESFAELPHGEQEVLYSLAPSWELLNVAKDPGRLWGPSQNDPKNGTQVPTYRVLRSLSVQEIRPYHSSILIRILFRYLDNALGDNHDAWVTFESLYESWTGTFGELMDTVTSMH